MLLENDVDFEMENIFPHHLDLAPEIWMQVFEWACRDSGATGRSLGLVNKDFRRLSRSYTYQSIHLPRENHIFAFREHLSTLSTDQKRVKFLHTPCPHIFMNGLSLDDDIEYDDEDDFEEDGQYLNAIDEPEESEVLRREAFRDILSQVSSSLLVLSVYWNSKFSVPLGELLVSLPQMEELHINRRFIDVRPDPQAIQLPEFPNLRRLHYAGLYGGEGSLLFDDFLALIAPQLTHIYVPIFYLRTLKSKLQDSLQVVVVDMGPVLHDAANSYDDVAAVVFGGPPVNGKTLILIDDEDSEWLENSEGWEARWKLSNGARNRPPWLTW